MKTLLILRHAKAQPDAPHGDKARELTARGRRNAAAIGEHLHGLIGRPDAVVTSDARRAHQTAQIVAEACEFTAPLTLEPRLYGADPETLLATIGTLPDSAESVLLVGHNPGLEWLSAALADQDSEVRLPTAGLANLELEIARWSEVRPGIGRWRGLTTPRELA
jgi:phosphohistidine phosphatase